jgi:glyoxylase I family protein
MLRASCLEFSASNSVLNACVCRANRHHLACPLDPDLMKIEHFALNVADPAAMADWYCLHLGFEIARRSDGPSAARFLRDPATGVMIEAYHNPPDQVPDYAAMDPMLLHIAFATADLAADRDALQHAGAVLVSEQTLADGSIVAMLRDPWGLCIQLCQRAAGFFG